jgi:DNA helicase-2/ATP-dependent DNA helicase PcrA
LHTLESMFPWCGWEEERRALSLYVGKLTNQTLDYDTCSCIGAMMSDARVAGEIGAQFDHITWTNTGHQRAAAEILKQLRPGREGVTVVGDDAQAIYSFRRRPSRTFLNFETVRGAPRPGGGGDAGRELPFHAGCARRRQCADR